jgi:agmatinase
MQEFNPNDLAINNGNLYGLPASFMDSELVVFSVPWDVTVSYSDGTSGAPVRIQEESLQVDLYDLDYGNFWKKGIYYLSDDKLIREKSEKYRPIAKQAIDLLEKGYNVEDNEALKLKTKEVNMACQEMIDWVYSETLLLIDQGKKVCLLGGDHSTPLGYLKALSEKHTNFGILQIDAHCDLRDRYEGFVFSHASIMYNALKLSSIESLTQVGIRDFCEDEIEFAKRSKKNVSIFFDRDMKYQKIEGKTWKEICHEIVLKLPNKLYISFDIDGLNPLYCPKTGTPVAGGLELDEVFYLFNLIKQSNIEIIGMDLNEVGNDVWDANVGARVLYRMLGLWMA